MVAAQVARTRIAVMGSNVEYVPLTIAINARLRKVEGLCLFINLPSFLSGTYFIIFSPPIQSTYQSGSEDDLNSSSVRASHLP